MIKNLEETRSHLTLHHKISTLFALVVGSKFFHSFGTTATDITCKTLGAKINKRES